MRFSTGADATDGSCRNVTADATSSSLGAMVGTSYTEVQHIQRSWLNSVAEKRGTPTEMLEAGNDG